MKACPSCGAALVPAFDVNTEYVRCPREGTVYALSLIPE